MSRIYKPENSLEILQDEIRGCQQCELWTTMPFNPVPGIGPKRASVMIIGEAPGEDESIAEEPFVGACGRFLDTLLERAGIDRSEVYICNTVNCRPTVDGLGKKNRPPTKKEISSCSGWLDKQILEVRPTVIFTLGKIPTCSIRGLKSTIKLADYVGKWGYIYPYHSHQNIHYSSLGYWHTANYHPSYLLQYGKDKTELAIKVFKEGLAHLKAEQESFQKFTESLSKMGTLTELD